MALNQSLSPVLHSCMNLLSQGREAVAIETMKSFLAANPMSGSAWTDSGILWMAIHNYLEALVCFQRAAHFLDCPKEMPLHLAKTFLALNRPSCAAGLMDSLAAGGLLEEGLIEQIARMFYENNNAASAQETLIHGQRLITENTALAAYQEQIRTRRAKIAFFCGGDGATFLKDIINYASQRFQIRVFEGGSTQQMFELMRWSDISWFEWCTNLAQIGSAMPKVCHNIIRLHKYEAYAGFHKQVQWNNIDYLMTVGNSYVIQAMEQFTPDIRNKVRMITVPNGVDLGKIDFVPRRPGKNLAFIASLRMVKNTMYLLQCMAYLYRMDPSYKLYIAGAKTDILMEQYFDYHVKELGLQDAIVFDGWQKDIPGWLVDKQYLISTSLIESQGMGIMEAMAAGIRPVIHNFPGAREIYDDQYLFNTPDDFCTHILTNDYDSVQYREFVETRYSQERQMMTINELFVLLENTPMQKDTHYCKAAG